MECYYVYVKDLGAFKKFAKNNLKKYKIWIPPKDLFENCVFVMTNEDPPVSSKFEFKKLTVDLYRSISEERILKTSEDVKVEVKDKIEIVSPSLSFKGIVSKVKKDFVYVIGKVFKKNIKVMVPKDYIRDNIKRK